MENVTIRRQVTLELTNEQYGLKDRYRETGLAKDLNLDFQRFLNADAATPNSVREKMRVVRQDLGDAVWDEMKFVETVDLVIREFYQV